MSPKDPNSRLVGWRHKLEEFDYEIEYKRWKSSTNADVLSRIEIDTKTLKELSNLEQYIEFNERIKRISCWKLIRRPSHEGCFGKITISSQKKS